MMSEETRTEADRAKDVYVKRLSSAEGVRPAGEIDWAAYARALPEVDIAAFQAAYAKAAAAIPEVTYDEAADKKAHEAKEAAWVGFSNYCASRVTELEQLAAEQEKHKLHQHYRRRQLYSRCVPRSPVLRCQRSPLLPPPPAHPPLTSLLLHPLVSRCSFPGLYESLHHKVRGQWDVEIWAQYLAYRSKTVPLPWDPNHGDMTAEKKAELKAAIAAKAGTTVEALGWK